MPTLDSLYAMVAKPIQAKLKRKRIVEQANNGSGMAADSHETPQAQLPPHLERRQTAQDRRDSPRGDRRVNAADTEDTRKAKASHDLSEPTTSNTQAEQEAISSLLPRIDIDV